MSELNLVLYLPNKPDLNIYRSKRKLRNLQEGEVQEIISLTGNHWRKIFSIYSKISYELNLGQTNTWQEYRDKFLLTQGGIEIISFSKRIVKSSGKSIHIIAGKLHIKDFNLSIDEFSNVDREGRILKCGNIYLTPYFDYRQFPNHLIDSLLIDIKGL